MDAMIQQVETVLTSWGVWSDFTGVVSGAIILGLVAYSLKMFGGKAGR